MSKVWQVAWREFRVTVFRPVFLLAVIGIPVLVIGVMIIAVTAMSQFEQPPLVGKIVVVEASGQIAEAAKIEFDQEQIRLERKRDAEQAKEQGRDAGMPPGLTNAGTSTPMMQRGEVKVEVESLPAATEEELSELNDRVFKDELLAVAVVTPDVIDLPEEETDENPTFELTVGTSMDSDHVSLIERQIGDAVVRVRAKRRLEIEPEEALAILTRPRAATSRATGIGELSSESKVLRAFKKMIPMVFMMLIWIGTLTSGQHLLMSTIEEKSNKVMEVLLSALSPFQLMTGKILGYGAVGLLIVLLYSSVGIAALIVFERMGLIALIDLFYLAVFYLMAYFMIAAIMAAVGSAVSDIREANILVTPVMMVLMIPLVLWFFIIEAPNGMIARVFSFLPPAIPFAMILRLSAEEPIPLWEVITSIAWGFICVFGMIWLAAKVFRVGVLMYGKPPSPLELIKWIRYA